jgi:hypothetical protein
MNTNVRVTNIYPLKVNPDTPGNPIDQALTVSGAVVSFAPFQERTTIVTFDVQFADVRVRFGADDPTAVLGHVLYAGQSYTWSKQQAAAAKFIAIGGDAELFATELTT